MARQKITVDGKDYEAREEEFEIFQEPWSEYRLMGGGRLKLKTVVQKIFFVVDENGDVLVKDGEPVVMVKHISQVVVSR